MKHAWSKVSLATFFTLVVLCGVAVGLVAHSPGSPVSDTGSLSPQPDQPNTWRTYNNSDYGFRLSYPADDLFLDQSGTDSPSEGFPHVQIGGIQIVLPPNLDPGYHPKAVTLEDFGRDYTTLESCGEIKRDDGQQTSYACGVVVHESREAEGIATRALYQTYSTGSLRPGGFYSGGEYDDRYLYRFVFWDGNERFVIMKSTADKRDRLERIARTFVFLAQP